MENIYLSDLCSFLRIKFDFPRDFQINNVCTDTRKLRAGDVFLALIGQKHDGHDYIQIAIDKGASALIVVTNIRRMGVPVLKVPDI